MKFFVMSKYLLALLLLSIHSDLKLRTPFRNLLDGFLKVSKSFFMRHYNQKTIKITLILARFCSWKLQTMCLPFVFCKKFDIIIGHPFVKEYPGYNFGAIFLQFHHPFDIFIVQPPNFVVDPVARRVHLKPNWGN